MVKEDQWGDLECLHKACQATITDGGLFTDTGVDERCGNERQGENDCETKTVSRVKRPENRQELAQTRLRRKWLFKKKGFEFRMKLMRGQGKEEKNQWQCRVMDAPKAAAVVLEENSRVQSMVGKRPVS